MFNPMLGKSLERNFLYGTLLWDFNDALYVYGSYSVFQVNDYVGMDDGVSVVVVRRRVASDGECRREGTVCEDHRPIVRLFPLNLGIPIIAVSVMF